MLRFMNSNGRVSRVAYFKALFQHLLPSGLSVSLGQDSNVGPSEYEVGRSANYSAMTYD